MTTAATIAIVVAILLLLLLLWVGINQPTDEKLRELDDASHSYILNRKETNVPISMNKNYVTRAGLAARVICVDYADGGKMIPEPVLSLIKQPDGFERLSYHNSDGRCGDGSQSTEHDLIEVTPWHDIKVDEPVIAIRMDGSETRAHFAGIRNCGPTIWDDGLTSWMSRSLTAVSSCRRPTEKELECHIIT